MNAARRNIGIEGLAEEKRQLVRKRLRLGAERCQGQQRALQGAVPPRA